MAKYLKIFNQHSQYEAYTNSEGFLVPNVSWCEDQKKVVHYNPMPSDNKPSIIATYYVEGEGAIRSLTMLYYVGQGPQSEVIQGVDMFSKILIDGDEVSIADIDADGGYYSFTEGGEHEVIYYLIDPTTVPFGAFKANGNYDVPPIVEVEFGEGVEVIDGWAFSDGSSLQSVTFPNTLTSIGDYAFANTAFSTVELPNGLTTIGEHAFDPCYNLSTVNIPSSVTTIGSYAFCNTNIPSYSSTWNAIYAINPTAVCGGSDSK